ncbi:MAG TPA: UDP-N-acetylenolpyruvoylglucosamine reductase, partial [Roseomonas sp.]
MSASVAPVERMTEAPLPPMRGRVQAGAPLGPATWFRVGGAADWLVRPADVDDLLRL